MWRWFSRKQVVAPGAPRGGETAAEAETGFDTLAEPLVWAPTAPMPAPPLRDEVASLRASELRRLAALQARGDAAYQYVVDIAMRICQVPLAAIALLDGDTLWFKACAGFNVETTPAARSPCRLVIDQGPEVTVLDEVGSDARFAGYPVFAALPGLRFYAGAPLITSQGVTVGTVSVADYEPRELSPVQLRTLELLARQTALLLEARARHH